MVLLIKVSTKSRGIFHNICRSAYKQSHTVRIYEDIFIDRQIFYDFFADKRPNIRLRVCVYTLICIVLVY